MREQNDVGVVREGAGANAPAKRQPVFAGHLQVGYHDGDVLIQQLVPRGQPVGRRLNVIAEPFQRVAHGEQCRWIVVDDQDSHGSASFPLGR